MRWLVAGAGGMLGQDLVPLLRSRGHDVIATGRATLDVTDPDAVAAAARGVDVVANCSAYTAVDAAEKDEAAAFAVNAVGAANLARAARLAGARVLQISTDYVFDGAADRPYLDSTPMAPRSAYGRTKAAGEWAVRAEHPDYLVVRTAYLYGAHGSCFPRTIARVAAERGAIDVVADQVGQPTWTVDLADLMCRLVEAVVTTAGLDPQIVSPTTSELFVRPAPRPGYSVLSHDSLQAAGVAAIGEWSERWAVAGRDVLAG